MIGVTFHKPSELDDSLLRFAVIMAKYRGKWVFCRHKERTTWEIPGGHREQGEQIDHTARRELGEETGALSAELTPVTVYGVTREGVTTYGMLYYAQIHELGPLQEDVEIGEIRFCEALPDALTYPAIQPALYREVYNFASNRS